MKLLLSYIRLVRPLNLLLILFTLYVVRFSYILPMLGFNYASLAINEVIYAVFSLSFVAVAAAGYIINDYYDAEIDVINKPGRVIIGSTISPQRAMITYIWLNVLGACAGVYSCSEAGDPAFSLLFVFYIAGLWLYSYKLKATFLAGNMLVAICLALVPLSAIYIQTDPDKIGDNSNAVHYFAWGLAFFAFLINLIREIVKDMQDTKGDAAQGCKTLPIVLGDRKTKIVIQLLLFLMIGLLVALEFFMMIRGQKIFNIYCPIFIQLPCLIVSWKIYKASSPRDYKRISGWLKFIMVTGISICFVFALQVWVLLQIFKI